MKKTTRVNHPPPVELAADNRSVVAPIYQSVKFEFDTALTVGTMYPITVDAPGVSLATTLEVTRCQLTVANGRFFLIEGRFYPYVA